MQKIPLSMLRPGMVSADAVKSRDGLILVNAGETLDESIIRRLSTLKKTHITILGRGVSGYDMGYDAEACAKRVPYLFRRFKNDEQMMRLATFLERHFASRYSS